METNTTESPCGWERHPWWQWPFDLMKCRLLALNAHDEDASHTASRLKLDLVLFVTAEQLRAQRTGCSDSPVHRIVPLAAQDETHQLVIIEVSNDDPVSRLDAISRGAIGRLFAVCRPRLGVACCCNAVLRVALFPYV